MRPKTREKAIDHLTQRYGPLSPESLTELEEGGYFSDALDPSYADGWTFLEKWWRRFVLIERAERGNRPPPTEIADFDLDLTQAELDRMFLVSRALARRAAHEQEVVAVRQNVIGGFLAAESARDLIQSLPMREYSFEGLTNLQERGVEFLDHQADLTDLEARFNELCTMTPAVEVPFQTEHGSWDSVLGRPESFLGQLWSVAELLTLKYPWDPRQAFWWLLTGKVPVVHPLRAWSERRDYPPNHTRGVITLEVEPWVDAKTVMKAYRSLQRFMIGAADNRQVFAHSCAVFDFVDTYLDASTATEVRWDSVMNLWNREEATHDKERYTRSHKMRELYNRVKNKVLTPRYHMLGDASREPFPPGTRWEWRPPDIGDFEEEYGDHDGNSDGNR
jgi:hypothetical protein